MSVNLNSSKIMYKRPVVFQMEKCLKNVIFTTAVNKNYFSGIAISSYFLILFEEGQLIIL